MKIRTAISAGLRSFPRVAAADQAPATVRVAVRAVVPEFRGML